MATKKNSTTSKGGKQPPREPGFFSDYGGSGISNLKLPSGATPKKSGGKKK